LCSPWIITIRQGVISTIDKKQHIENR